MNYIELTVTDRSNYALVEQVEEGGSSFIRRLGDGDMARIADKEARDIQVRDKRKGSVLAEHHLDPGGILDGEQLVVGEPKKTDFVVFEFGKPV